MKSEISRSELLEARILSNQSSNFKVGYAVELEEEYPFYISNVFFRHDKTHENMLERFGSVLIWNIREYIYGWAEYTRKKEGGIWDERVFFNEAFSFCKSIDIENIFSKIESGENPAKVKIQAAATTMQIKRFGDCLGIKITGLQKDSDHRAGLAVAKTMIRERANRVSLFEFFSKIENSIHLPGAGRTDNEYWIVDFAWIFEKFNKYLPDIVWDSEINSLLEKIIQGYKDIQRDGVKVGSYYGLPLYFKLSHLDAVDKKKDIGHDNYYYPTNARIWREGNVHRNSNEKNPFAFRDSQELNLVIIVNNSLPWELDPTIDISSENHDEQFKIRDVGAMIYTQLCIMLKCIDIEAQMGTRKK